MPVNPPRPSSDRRHAAHRTQAERAAATRDALIRAATDLFAARGYVDTPREKICRRARVTRGALDHHFDGKKGLFRAVVEDVEIRLDHRIAAAALSERDPVARLKAGCHAYLDAATEPEVRRILLLDARAVLGWRAWQEIHAEHGLRLTIEGLRAALGRDRERSVEPLAHVLLAALTEAALYVATADDPDAARSEVRETADRILDAVLA